MHKIAIKNPLFSGGGPPDPPWQVNCHIAFTFVH